MKDWGERPLRAYSDIRLGRQRSPENSEGPHMIRYLRAANVQDGTLDLSDVKVMNFTPEEQVVFSLRSGDVLVTEGSGSLSSVGASAVWREELSGVVCFQNTLIRLRPRSDRTDGRFLGWWARHAFADGRFAAIATGANIHHVSAERVRDLRMRFPPLDIQRAIADFLDDETARLDAVIAKKRRLVELLSERLSCQIDGIVWSSGGKVTPLTHLVPPNRRIMYGIVLPGPDVEDGVPIVKGGDVKMHRLNRADVSRTTHEIEAGYARSRLLEGDLVFSIRGGVGDVEVVPAELAGANITQDVARIAPGELVSGRWLLHSLRSRTTQEDVHSRMTGATIRGINIWDLGRVAIPVPGIDVQVRLADHLDVLTSMCQRTTSMLGRQIDLLVERRQALITAAVTGELDVSNSISEEAS